MSTSIDTPIGPIELDAGRFDHLRSGVDDATPLPRLCYAASHVVMAPSYATVQHRVDAPGTAEEIAEHLDWDATMAVRSRIGATGMGIAEAMDTAQRFNLGWTAARELIERTGRLGLPGGFCAGAGTDHLERADTTTAIVDGVVEQIGVIRQAGGVPVVLPMQTLCELGLDEDGYCEVYDAIARHAGDGPLVAAIGPAARGCCYEVDRPVRAALRERHAAWLAEAMVPGRADHWQLDLPLLAERVLAESGLDSTQIGTAHRVCTICNGARFESYRRDGAAAGRLRHFIKRSATIPRQG